MHFTSGPWEWGGVVPEETGWEGRRVRGAAREQGGGQRARVLLLLLLIKP